MHATATATVAVPAVVRDADSPATERAEFRKALLAFAEMLASLDLAARNAEAFIVAADALYSDEVRRHDIAGVREDAVHVLYGIQRDISIMESSANRRINGMVERAAARLARASIAS
jgi:hypothetical protein